MGGEYPLAEQFLKETGMTIDEALEFMNKRQTRRDENGDIKFSE